MLGLTASAFAQNWVEPAKTPGTPVLCPPSVCKSGGWLPPYQAPISAFTGRFMDSSNVGDSNRWPIATIRSMGVKSVAGSDRFYLHMNASVGMYKKASFISRLAAGETLARATSYPRAGGSRGPDGVERVLLPDATFAAPFADGWYIPVFDFTPQLGSIDMDDRGYVYLAYWQYGFGIIKDVETDFSPVTQVMETGVLSPTVLVTMKTSTGRYITLISDSLGDAAMFDVTTPSTPTPMGKVRLSAVNDAAKSLAQDRIALLDTTGTIRIFSSDALAAGNISPLNTFKSADNGIFTMVVTDGTNFYGVAKTPNASASVTILSPSGGAYTAVRYDLPVKYRGSPASFVPSSANFTDGYLTIAGGFGSRDLRVFRVGVGAPVEVDMNDYLRNAYADPPPPADGKTFVTASTVVNPGANQLTGGAVMKISGKEYLIVAAKGLGDVYELKGSDGITLKVDGPSGTPNPRGAQTQTLYYGDPVKFTATGANTTAQATLQWEFGNSEGTADPNVITGVAGQSVTHRYSGISKSGVATPRTVKASSVSNPAANDTKTVTFTLPLARVGIAGLSSSRYVFGTGGATDAPLVVGDNFYDGSDGLTEGHFSVWTIDGVEAARGRATDLVPVGNCGAHTLTMSALYGPASGTGATLATLNGADFTQSVSGLTYSVRPFVADIELSGSDATSLTFASKARLSADTRSLPASISSALTYRWDLVNSTGASLLAGPSGSASSILPFAIPRSALAAGSRARLTLTSPTALPGSCAGFETSYAESSLLDPPNPVIVGDCTNGAPPCSFRVDSTGGVDPVAAGWTYAWSSSSSANVSPATSTQRTWAPSFSQAGTYTLTVTVTNAISSTQATKNVVVTTAATACGQLVDGTLLPLFEGKSSGCTNGVSTCSTSENIQFALAIADGKYLFGCAPHTITWSFPDGTTATGLNPPAKRFTTVGNHTVNVTVANGTQSKVYSVIVPVGGSVQQPQPQPQQPQPQQPQPQQPQPQQPQPQQPQGCSTLTPNVSMVIVYANSNFSCSNISQGGCKSGDKITFYVQDYEYNSACATHTFAWTFGDGGTATGRGPDHTYATNGTFNVRCNVTVNGQTYALTQAITLGGNTQPQPQQPQPQQPQPQQPQPQQPQPGSCPTFVPNQSMSIVFQDPSFTCTNVSQAGCSTSQTLDFFASEFGATYNSTCATHTFSWDFGDGSTANGRSASHKFTSNGTFNVKCNVTVNGQTHVLTQQVSIGGGSQNPATPEVEVDFAFAANGRTYTFTPTVVKSVNAQIARWDWDFGDGTTTRVTSAQPLAKSNTYAAGGTFNVTLNVYDSSNRLLHTRTRVVVISSTTRSRAVRH